jgi:predicted CoA-binding protein
MSNSKKTLVLGASENPGRYSYLAVNRLLDHGHEVIAIGKSKGMVRETPIITEQVPVSDVDTITLYLNPLNQQKYYDFIIATRPKRIIFNPGTENIELESLAEGAGIETMEACTLVMLSTGQY